MSAEDINNIPDVGASQEAPSSAPEISQSQPAREANPQPPALTQAQINKMTQEALRSDPSFQQFEKLKEVFNPQQKQVNPFDAELGLYNVTEAAQYLNQGLTQQERELLAVKQDIAAFKQEKAVRDYESAMETFTTHWEDSYADEESFNGAIAQAIQLDPNLARQYQAAQQGVGTLDANFIANLNQTMNNLWVAKLKDPSSGALDTLIKQAQQRKMLQDQSMLSSNAQTTDAGRSTDKFSSKLVIFDD
jgi:hypothetical protein